MVILQLQPIQEPVPYPLRSYGIFYPTILKLAGLPPRPKQHVDGVSFVPLLQGKPMSRGPMFWHYPHYGNQGGFPGGGIRMGNWKLLERFEDGQVHLFDLAHDIGERNDLAATEKERTRAMRARLHAWYRTTGAKFLRPKDGKTPWRPDDAR